MWQTPLFLLWTLCSAIFFHMKSGEFWAVTIVLDQTQIIVSLSRKRVPSRESLFVYIEQFHNWSYLESWALSIWSFNIITLSLTSLLIIVFFEQEIWACLSKDVKLKSRRTQQHLIVCFVKTAARPPEHRGETWRGRWAGANPFPAPP